MGLLIGALHLRNGHARPCRHLEHLFCSAERIGHGLVDGCLGLALHGFEFSVRDDKTAAHRIIDPAQKHLSVPVEGSERHTIGVTGQGLLPVKDQIRRRIEIIVRMTGRTDLSAGLDGFDDVIHPVRINLIRQFAGEAEHDRPARSVTDPGEGQRSVQADLDSGDARTGRTRPIGPGDFIEKTHRRGHRPHGVGARRSDADLEDIKD